MTRQVPEYIQRFLRERKELAIVISDHAIRSRPGQKAVTTQQIFKVVQEGEVDVDACQEFEDKLYDKIATYRYFAEESRTIKAIVTVNWEAWLCQVETIWTYPGRQHRGRSDQERREH